jgi:Ca2+-binding EF-hand superfamily protein
MENSLQVEEINEFLKRGFDETIDGRDFRKMLKSYSHDSQHRIDRRGFIQLVRDRVAESEKFAW